MINTIFYFIDHLPFDEYVNKINSGDIADHTIVFVDDTKAIYKGGLWFGSTSDPDNINNIINLIQENAYSLPIASSLVLGGIRVGDNLQISPEGLLSVGDNVMNRITNVENNVTNVLNSVTNVYTEGIVVTPIKTSGEQIATIKVGNTTKQIYAAPAYNDSAITSRLTTVENAINGLLGGSNINITDLLSGGTKIAKITIGTTTKTLYAPTQLQYDDSAISSRLTTVENAIAGLLSGSNISVLSFLSSGTKIATITIGNISTDLYAPTGTYNPDDPNNPSDPGTIPTYDDSALREWLLQLSDKTDLIKLLLLDKIAEIETAISNIQAASETEKARLDGIIDSIDSEIEDRVEALFSDEEWVRQMFPNGTGSYSNFGVDDVKEYLQIVGLWFDDDNTTSTFWSDIRQNWNSIKLKVNSVVTTDNGEYTISETLLSWIEAYVDDQVAGLNQGTMYARVDDVSKILEWMYSGLKAVSSPTLTYTQLVSAAKNNTLGTTAIAGLTTRIETIENEYVAESVLSTKVGNALASIIESVKTGWSITKIINSIGTNSENIASLTSSVQNLDGRILSETQILNSVKSQLTTQNSSIWSAADNIARTATAGMMAYIKDNNTNTVTAASLINAIVNADGSASTTFSNYVRGVATVTQDGQSLEELVESYVNSIFEAGIGTASWATWALTVSNSIDAISGIETRVLNIEGNYISSANLGTLLKNLSANTLTAAGIVTTAALNSAKTELTSSYTSAISNAVSGLYTTADANEAIATLLANINSSTSPASIVASINSSGSTIKLNADKINLTGDTVVSLINGGSTTISGSKITTGSITATQIDATNLKVAAANITGTLTASQINTTGLSVSAANVTGKLTATLIDSTGLSVAAANVTGKLTASLIDSSSLHVNAANIDGTLTVTAANVSGLTGAIQSTEINGSKITTGTISAARIDSDSLHVNAANIDGTISATKVDTSDLTIGNPSKYTVSTDGTKVSFNYLSTSNAYFTSENGGMQLYIKGPGGDWYSVDFSKWNNVTNPQPSYPSHSLTIYKLRGGGSLGIVSSTKTIYYESNLSFDNSNKQRRFGKCYTDEQGLNPATSSTLSGTWYYAPQDTYYFALVRTSSDSTLYEPVLIRPLLPVTINDIGILLAQDKDTSVIYAAGIEPTADISTATTYILEVQNSPVSVNDLHIYSTTGGSTPIGATSYDTYDTYDVYPLKYTNTVPTTGPWHISVLSVGGGTWMVTTVNTHA